MLSLGFLWDLPIKNIADFNIYPNEEIKFHKLNIIILASCTGI